jgi:hypothetical protein
MASHGKKKILTSAVNESRNLSVGKLDLVANDVDESSQTRAADNADLGLGEVGGKGAATSGEESEGSLELLDSFSVGHGYV